MHTHIHMQESEARHPGAAACAHTTLQERAFTSIHACIQALCTTGQIYAWKSQRRSQTFVRLEFPSVAKQGGFGCLICTGAGTFVYVQHCTFCNFFKVSQPWLIFFAFTIHFVWLIYLIVCHIANFQSCLHSSYHFHHDLIIFALHFQSSPCFLYHF
jgi:hypothetical protein